MVHISFILIFNLMISLCVSAFSFRIALTFKWFYIFRFCLFINDFVISVSHTFTALRSIAFDKTSLFVNNISKLATPFIFICIYLQFNYLA